MSNTVHVSNIGVRRRLAAFGSTAFLACVAVGLLLAVGQGPAAARTYGRVSYIEGDLMVRGVYDDDWSFAGLNTTLREGDALWTDADSIAEIELGYGTFVRIGYGTELYIDEFPRNAELRLVSGGVYLSRNRQDGRLRLTTPTADILVRKNALVRVDAAEDGSTRVSVVRGLAEVDAPGARLSEVEAGWRVYVYPGEGPSGWERLSRQDEDEFDRFNRRRDAYYAELDLPTHVDRDIVGIYDLRRHGRWVTVRDVRYWRPSIPDWRPYRHGRWGWLHAGGWSWRDDYPFGYVTGHYGRWLWTPQYGWVWRPGHVWGPGWVSWVTFDDYVGWAPLDPWDRPAYVSVGLSVPLGRHGHLSIGASSYAPRSSFFLSYVRARPFSHTTINIIRHQNVRIVNNYITHNEYTYVDNSFSHHVHHNIAGLLRPRVRGRGPASNERGRRAAAVIQKLEHPGERAKRWSWRSRHVDLAALRRLREARPEHADGHRSDVHQGPGSTGRVVDRKPAVSGRDPRAWSAPRRPEERIVKPTPEPSREGIWHRRSGAPERDQAVIGSRPPDRKPPIRLGHDNRPGTTDTSDRRFRIGDGKPVERPSARPPVSARPTWVLRQPGSDERKAGAPSQAWRSRSSVAARPPAKRPEPERRVSTERTPVERRMIHWVRPTSGSQEARRRPTASSSSVRPEAKEPTRPSRSPTSPWTRRSTSSVSSSAMARPGVAKPTSRGSSVVRSESSRPRASGGSSAPGWTKRSSSPASRSPAARASASARSKEESKREGSSASAKKGSGGWRGRHYRR